MMEGKARESDWRSGAPDGLSKSYGIAFMKYGK